MATAKDMTAISKKQPRDETILGIDAIGETLNSSIVAVVYVCKSGATYAAGVNEVEGSNTLLEGRLRQFSAHSGVLVRLDEVGEEYYRVVIESAKIKARQLE